MSKYFNRNLVAESLMARFDESHKSGLVISKKIADEIVYWFQELIQQEVYRGNPVNLPMLGMFKLVHRKPRNARNPRNGNPVKAPASYTVKFRPSKKMKAWLNKGRNQQKH